MHKVIRAAAFIVVLTIISFLPRGAVAMSYSPGGVESVGSKQGLGAFGNPAFLPFNKTGTILTVIYTGRPLFSGSGEDTNLNLTGDTNSYDNDSSSAAQIFAGFVHDNGDSAWSLALGTLDKGFFVDSEKISLFVNEGIVPGLLGRCQNLKSEDSITNSDTNYHDTWDTTFINPAMAFSYGLMLTSRDGIGIQAIVGYASEKTSRDEGNIGGTTMKSESERSGLYTTALLGYYKRLGATDIGVMLKSGVFTLESQTKKIDAVIAGINYTDETSYSWKFIYTYGASLVAGVYTRQFSWVGACLEFEISLPSQFKRNDPYFNMSTYRYTDWRWRVQLRPTAAVRGGLEFYLGRWAVLSVGGGVQFESTTWYFNNPDILPTRWYIERQIMTSTVMLGFDYCLTRNFALNLGAQYSMIEAKFSHDLPELNTATYKSETTVHTLDLMVGLSFYF